MLVSTFSVAAMLLVFPGEATQAAGPSRVVRAAIVQVSADPFTNAGAQHATEVEPDTVTAGRRVMSVFQVGRYAVGCADDLGWAFSRNDGRTWKRGFLPGLTKSSDPPGPFDRVSDPSVAYDARFKEWLAAGLDCEDPAPGAPAVSVNISRNGVHWSMPVIVARASSTGLFDKGWITCDNTPSSRFFGNCYIEWDLASGGDSVVVSTSRDGGQHWSPPAKTASGLQGLAGEPVVLHNGTVVVPIVGFLGQPSLVDFRSTNGGRTWGKTVMISGMDQHAAAGDLRGPKYPSVTQDASGRIYLAWPDCRFRARCASNDMVMTTSADGLHWSRVIRIPIDPVTSTVDHLGGGIGADPASSGKHARLGLFYYFYPDTNCTTATCRIFEGFVSSTDGGARWSPRKVLAGPFKLRQLALAGGFFMTGDYQGAAVIAGGNAWSAFAASRPPSGGQKLNEAMFEPARGEPITGGSLRASAAGARSYAPARIPRIIL
jgi:hypothetical protein